MPNSRISARSLARETFIRKRLGLRLVFGRGDFGSRFGFAVASSSTFEFGFHVADVILIKEVAFFGSFLRCRCVCTCRSLGLATTLLWFSGGGFSGGGCPRAWRRARLWRLFSLARRFGGGCRHERISRLFRGHALPRERLQGLVQPSIIAQAMESVKKWGEIGGVKRRPAILTQIWGGVG